ncbi:MAG: group II intron reverse transcriptase/maturase [Actinobacteria bacterium]|nr:group II intron reverse transcriptase/maturase [Actinomycetota bacterium]
MDDREKSDGRVVPERLPNNVQGGAAEAVEGRRPAKGNAAGETRSGPSAGQGALSELGRVRRVAATDREAQFTALLHHIDVGRLRAAYFALRPKAAPGVDGVTWEDYGGDLEANLRDLHARVHRGAYRARPSRRVYIPKPDGRQRPLGVASLEDKILQRALVEVLNAIYETDFLGFSHGFRPGRSPHHALDALAAGIVGKKVNWVLDADFRDYFSSLDHRWLERFLEHRIADKRVLRLIQKWLAAGIIENGSWTAFEEGVPQGASASPLLANVYLHYVFDLWAHQWRTRHAHGDVVITRFADDFVVGFEHREDAERFWADLRGRLAEFGLELNAEKTRLIEFGRFAARNREARGLGKPETFQFLGFTHVCGKTRKSGRFKLKRITDSKRVRAKLHALKGKMRRRMHLPIPEQARWLASVLRGHYQYYAVPDNSEALNAFRKGLIRHWLRALRRRSQRSRLTWERMWHLADRWLPQPRILHPWPEQRFAAITQGRSPVR